MSMVEAGTVVASSDVDSRLSGLSEQSELIIETLKRSDSPLAATNVLDQLKRHLKLKLPELSAELITLRDQGIVFEYAPYRGKAVRYSVVAPLEYMRQGILSSSMSVNKTKSEIKKSIGKIFGDWTAKQIDEQIDLLTEEGKLKLWPAKKGCRSASYSRGEVTADSYVKDELAAVVKALVKKLGPAGISESAIWQAIQIQALDQIHPDEEVIEERLYSDKEEPVSTQVSDPAVELQTVILERIPVIEPRAVDGAVVLLSELRNSLDFQSTKQEFDDAILALASRYKIALSEQIRDSALSDEQRNALVTDENGRSYNALSLRRSNA